MRSAASHHILSLQNKSENEGWFHACLSHPETGMDSRNVSGGLPYLYFPQGSAWADVRLACHRSACLSHHLASMAWLSLCSLTVYNQSKTGGSDSCVHPDTGTAPSDRHSYSWKLPPVVVRFSHHKSTGLRDIRMYFCCGFSWGGLNRHLFTRGRALTSTPKKRTKFTKLCTGGWMRKDSKQEHEWP